MKFNKFIVTLIVFLVVAIGSYLFYKEGTLAVNKTDKTNKIFVVKQGESLDEIAQSLRNEGLIRNRIVFFLVVKQLGLERKIQAGDFRLSPSMTAAEVAQNLTHGTLDKWITVIEGLRKEEIADQLAKQFDISVSEFTTLAPEGYLFPDTYLVPTDASAENIISILTNTFDKKYTPELQEKARKIDLTKEQVVILASMVEREARTESDRKQVASILLKRYRSDWSLDIDATIQYALGYQPAEKRWWKKRLTAEDIKLDSPYNTYKNAGLPPGPICNPSLSSITAVVNANPNTPYWFYLTDLNGKTHFAKTLEEHNANIAKYLY